MDKERITRHIEHVKEFSSQKKLEAVEFVRQSPLKKLQQIVRNTVHSEIDAKIQLLQKVPVFDHTSPEILRALALRCEEVQCLCGDVIVREHFLNDGLHILLEGLFIAKKSSHVMGVDPVESIHEPNFFFGEKSFLSDDIAPATISVASNTAKYLLLTKSSHDEVKGLFGESVRMICKAVVDEMPLFKTFTTAQKQNVINALVEVKFSPGTYICRQGDIGNTFYIVAEGECSVTICSRELGGADTFIAKLHNGDFFGEVALVSKSNRRSANVVATTMVTCMVLSKKHFNNLLGSMKSTFSKRNILTNSQLAAVAKRRDSKTQGSAGSASGAAEAADAQSGERVKWRISSKDDFDHACSAHLVSLLPRMGKFTTEALWGSLYNRFYRKLVLLPDSVTAYRSVLEIFGLTASSQNWPEGPIVISRIASEVCRILDLHPTRRREVEHDFICEVMAVSHALTRDRTLCGDWQPLQIRALCKSLRLRQCLAHEEVVGHGALCSHAYLILKGSVRLFEKDHEPAAAIAHNQADDEPLGSPSGSTIKFKRRITTIESTPGTSLSPMRTNRKVSAAAFTDSETSAGNLSPERHGGVGGSPSGAGASGASAPSSSSAVAATKPLSGGFRWKHTEDLGPDKMFCRDALNGAKVSSVRVVSSTYCDLLVIEQSDYISAMSLAVPVMTETQKVKFLEGIPQFKHWRSDALHKLAREMKQSDVDKGTFLARATELPQHLNIIVDGDISVVMPDDPNEIITTLFPGGMFGEGSLTNVRSRQKHVQVVEEFDFVVKSVAARVLTLNRMHFGLLDDTTAAEIISSHAKRVAWRQLRAEKLTKRNFKGKVWLKHVMTTVLKDAIKVAAEHSHQGPQSRSQRSRTSGAANSGSGVDAEARKAPTHQDHLAQLTKALEDHQVAEKDHKHLAKDFSRATQSHVQMVRQQSRLGVQYEVITSSPSNYVSPAVLGLSSIRTRPSSAPPTHADKQPQHQPEAASHRSRNDAPSPAPVSNNNNDSVSESKIVSDRAVAWGAPALSHFPHRAEQRTPSFPSSSSSSPMRPQTAPFARSPTSHVPQTLFSTSKDTQPTYAAPSDEFTAPPIRSLLCTEDALDVRPRETSQLQTRKQADPLRPSSRSQRPTDSLPDRVELAFNFSESVNPLMVFPTCRNSKQVKEMYTIINQSRRVKAIASAKSSGVWSGKEKLR